MTAVRPDTCFAVYFDQLDALPANSTVYWQFVSQHTARDNVRRVRVHTVPLPVVATAAEAVKTASPDVMAILVAKREVLLARTEASAAVRRSTASRSGCVAWCRAAGGARPTRTWCQQRCSGCCR
jgi:hypothetical protein